MATANERRVRVAALRSQTRQYLIEARERRLGTFVEPEPPPAPERETPPRHTAFLPDPQIVALAPASPAATPPAASQAPAPAGDAVKETPLRELRLLGQGMIWRLNNLGLHTVQDLAACDPARLSEGLGPIGRLVRTEVWIEAAREILSQG